MALDEGDVVSFKLVNGAEIVGKYSYNDAFTDAVHDENVIHLMDALFVGIQDIGDGNARLQFAPITGIAENPDEGKPHIPFALYKSTILGQFPLAANIKKGYKEATSSILLVR